MQNELNLIQIVSILIILVLILIKIAPKVIDLVREKRADNQFLPYAFFKVENVSMKMFTKHSEGLIKFQQYFNKLGLYLFLLELDKRIRYDTDGAENLQSVLEDVKKFEKEGRLGIDDECADEES